MKSKTKRKLVFAVCSLSLIVVFIGVTIAVVLAAMQQSVSTSINVSYISKEVAGVVSATYKVKNGQEISMLNEQGGTTLEFDGSEGTTDGGSLSPDGDDIRLTSTNNNVVFKYSFTNTGDADYVATVSQTNTLDNLIMEISKDGVNYTSIKDYYMTVFGRTLTPQDYYVRFTIENVAKNVEANIAFKWDLKSIPRDTVAVANGEPYSSLDEAINVAMGVPTTFGATNMSTTDNNEYGIVSVIKDASIYEDTKTLSKKLLIYAENDVDVSQILNTYMFDIDEGAELMLGLPYDSKQVTIISNVTDTLIVGAGDVIINKGVLDNTSNNQGTAIDVLGKVFFYGGTIKNFSEGIYLNQSTSIKIGGTFENCSVSFTGSGNLLIDEDFEMSNTTISNITFKIENCTAAFNNVTFTNFPGSALDITGGTVTLNDCIVENCNDSAIKADYYSSLTIEDTIIRNNTAAIGAGIYNKGTLTINGDTEISGNTARSMGGGIYASGEITINNVLITNNSVTAGSGGGIYSEYREITQNGGVITKNTATNIGGGVFKAAAKYYMYGDSKVCDNSSGSNGGGVYVTSAALYMYDNSSVDNNTSSSYGGGVSGDGYVYMYDLSSVLNNTANLSGGGIYVTGNYQHCINMYDSSSVLNNTANLSGGGIYSTGTVNLYGSSSIKNNNAASYGDAIYYAQFYLGDSTNPWSGEITNNGGDTKDTSYVIYQQNASLPRFVNVQGAVIENFSVSKMTPTIFINSGSITFDKINYCMNEEGSDVSTADNMFVVGAGATLTLRNVDIDESKYKELTYSAINSSGNLIIEDSYIRNFESNSGGAIIASGGSVVIRNTTIENCSSSDIGGAIYLNGAVITTTALEVVNCSAKHGGAIFIAGTTTNSSINGTFTDNHATESGGAIAVYNGASTDINAVISSTSSGAILAATGGGIFIAGNASATISGGSFDGLMASSTGGAIHSDVPLTVSNAEIKNCTSIYGGGIFINGLLTLAGNTTISSNHATDIGGGIYSNAGMNLGNSTTAWSGSISQNSATTLGSGMFSGVSIEAVNTTSPAKIEDIVLRAASVKMQGGYLTVNNITVMEPLTSIFIVNGGTLSVSNSNFDGFDISAPRLITVNDGKFVMKDSIISNIYHSSNGGVAIVSGELAFDNVTISNCSTSGIGGVFYGEGSIDLKDCNISGCSAQNGGAIACAIVKLVNTNISDCYTITGQSVGAKYYGGAIYCVNISMTGGSITGCSAIDYGGAIVAEEEIILESQTISGCTAKYGGAIYITSAVETTSIAGSFVDNTATEYGGSIAIVDGGFADICANFSNTTNDLVNTVKGGAIFVSGGAVANVSGGTYTGLKVSETGGAISSEGTIAIDGATFTNCLTQNTSGADTVGGTLFGAGPTAVSNSTISGSSALYGGAIYANNLTVTGGTISGCSATSYGGAIFSTNLTMSGTTVNNCSAVNGGAIWAPEKLKATNVTMANCSASYGGAIYLYGNDSGNIISGTFIQNTVTENGGSIAVFDGGYASISVNCSNTTAGTANAKMGGAIFVSTGSSIQITGGEINGLKATSGGAVYSDGSVTMTQGTIMNCTAGNGGAMYLYGVTSTIAGVFRANTATEHGGALALYNGASVTVNAEFTNYDAQNNLLTTENNAKIGGAIYVGVDASLTVIGGSYSGLKTSSTGGAITNLGIATINNARFINCSSNMGGALANAVAGTSETAKMYISGLNISGCSATAGESNAIITIGELYLTGENTINEDICIAYVSASIYSFQGTIALSGGLNAHESTLKISFADGSISWTDVLAKKFENVSINISGTKSQSDTSIESGIAWDPFPAQ